MPGEAADGGPGAWAPAARVGVQREPPGFGLGHGWLLQPFEGGNQELDDLSLFFGLSNKLIHF